MLVDGRRPSAKDQTLEDILGRIPAAQVRYIEMLRGAEAAADPSGHAILLNVVRTPFTGQGFGSLGFEFAQQEEPRPNGTLVWSGRAHTVDYSLGANSYSFERELPGTRQLVDVDGNPSGTLRDVSPRDYEQYALNGEAASDAGRRPAAIHGQGVRTRATTRTRPWRRMTTAPHRWVRISIPTPRAGVAASSADSSIAPSATGR